jgi:WD40 repeat protein
VSTARTELTEYRLPSFTRERAIQVSPAGATAKRVLDLPYATTPGGRIVVWAVDPGPQGASDPPADQRLELADLRTGRVVGAASLGPEGFPETLNYAPGGAQLVVGTNAGRIGTYSATDLHPVRTDVPAADGFVFAAAYSKDGSTVVTTGTDGTLRFFDAHSLQPIGPPIRMPAANWTFGGFDGNGEQVAGYAPVDSGSQQYFSFPGDAAQWVTVACGIAGSELTSAEWARYVGDHPYTKVCGSG